MFRTDKEALRTAGTAAPAVDVARTNRLLGLRALVLCQEDQTRQPVQQVLNKLGVESCLCHDVESARENLASRRADLVIVDCDDVGHGAQFLKALRQDPSSRPLVSLAILNRRTTPAEAFRAGATLIVEKPVSVRLLEMIVRASLGEMLLEQRRSFRHAVAIPITLRLENGQEVQAIATNLSKEGIAIQASTAIPDRKPVQVHFLLPETRVGIQASGVVAWADLRGRAGIKFVEVPAQARKSLENWLRSHFEQWLKDSMREEDPIIIARKLLSRKEAG
jgi:DNA-binding response OmpR family regulator